MNSRVAVLLPIFQRPEKDVVAKWNGMTGKRHSNVTFDVHCYHCFGDEFTGKTFAKHLRHCADNAEMLRTYPMVVGEWSLALGGLAWATVGKMQPNEAYRLFGLAQQDAFRHASHGSFFWNWTEVDDMDWNFQMAYQQGVLSSKSIAVSLPLWDGVSEDPLEEQLNPSPSRPNICYGDKVFLRVFYGNYVDVEGSKVRARWANKGRWQQFTFCFAGVSASGSGKARRRPVTQGDVVRLRSSYKGRYLSLDNDTILASRAASHARTEFRVHIKYENLLKHRGIVFLQSVATGGVLNADTDAEGLFAHFNDFGEWQAVAVEKRTIASATHVRSWPQITDAPPTVPWWMEKRGISTPRAAGPASPEVPSSRRSIKSVGSRKLEQGMTPSSMPTAKRRRRMITELGL
jgi:hypothetical protein